MCFSALIYVRSQLSHGWRQGARCWWRKHSEAGNLLSILELFKIGSWSVFYFFNFTLIEVWLTHKTVIILSKYFTFSSKALWCSNKDFSALRTSTSLDTPEGDWACRFTTVILSDLSCRDTRHSKCSSNSYWGLTEKVITLNAIILWTQVTCEWLLPEKAASLHSISW